MTKSDLFRAAHAAARAATGVAYRTAFAAGLRDAYAALKPPAFVAPVITGCIRGGRSGAGAWVARITGRDARFGFAREFVRKGGHTSRSGRSGTLIWTLDAPGLYEIRNVQYEAGVATIGRLDDGFIRVGLDGSMTRVGKADVLAAL